MCCIVVDVTKDYSYEVCAKVMVERDVGSLESLVHKKVFSCPDKIYCFQLISESINVPLYIIL